jgi:hypothetical protein
VYELYKEETMKFLKKLLSKKTVGGFAGGSIDFTIGGL